MTYESRTEPNNGSVCDLEWECEADATWPADRRMADRTADPFTITNTQTQLALCVRLLLPLFAQCYAAKCQLFGQKSQTSYLGI